jgi:D-lyxose ketol-isomerase
MVPKEQLKDYQEKVVDMIQGAGIYITPEEKDRIEIADLGLSEFEQTGLGILVYVNTDRHCAKELAMWPRQTCPQHRHPAANSEPGKEETFRVRWGKCYLYVEGEPTPNPACKPPAGREDTYNIWHEIELNPGDQYTIAPNTWHWFQAGDEGAVVSEFSTSSTDEHDQFTDPQIMRVEE